MSDDYAGPGVPTFGPPLCDSRWEDPEVGGWMWGCRLPPGHPGDHRCHGACWSAGTEAKGEQ